MAKQAASPVPTNTAAVAAPKTWTLEDLPLIQEQIEAIGRALEPLMTMEARLTAAEAKLVNFDDGEQLLPSEVIAGLTPGQIYTAALNASITATIVQNPALHNAKEAFKQSMARNCITFAMLVLAEQLKQIPGKQKKTA